jgi:hypothetical protein
MKLVQPGEAQISFDANGLITHVDMTLSTKALGNSIGSSKLESIAKHESWPCFRNWAYRLC